MASIKTFGTIILFILRITFSNPVEITVRKFPKDFTFGVSTASYQIEGGWNASDKGENIWDRLVHTKPNMVKDESNADVSCDSYNLWQRDIQMLEELGVDFYRFSISWPRLLPSGYAGGYSKDGLNYYNTLIDTLLSKNIQPVITIYHWDLPQYFQDLGGWTNPLMASYFEDYAKFVFEAFGDRVKFWLTFNEPKQVCMEGYGKANMAPAINSPGIADYLCTHSLLLAHAKAYHLYDKKFRSRQKGQIGITLDFWWAEPDTLSPEDIEAAERSIQFNFGWFAHPIYSSDGDYPPIMKSRVAEYSLKQGFARSRLPEFTPAEIRSLKGSADFIGINHYSAKMVKAPKKKTIDPTPSFDNDIDVDYYYDKSWPGAASEWLKVVPWAFRKVLNRVREEYNNPPVLITESGYSTHGGLNDVDRIVYMNLYLNALLDAIEDGCNIVGYGAWSLMDNFEWMKGYTERFGLYEVDFTSPNRTRTPRASASAYTKIIRTRSIASDDDCMECEESFSEAYNAIIV